ncbi:ABC transporter ATP-binding protein [Adlercreutzia equolifaciens]|uniref:ABC transporter ATP-binding protein n=1 Tax=Adlercreutzia equolifaciens TaxID=446660 RepID=UPI0023AED220|nr:ABC transporter ATP-binding protein [Adlercreutzia equolifaciens]MDE8702149.1 ABC transporter ATP-binding protein [Adlercreutzia equolifaciens]
MSQADEVLKETHAEVSAKRVWSRFISYYGPYKALFFGDLLAAVVLAAIDLAFPQFLNFFTREFFLESPSVILSSLGLIALMFVALYLLRTGCQVFITYQGHVMGAYMEADMRRDLFSQYQRLSFSYYDRHNTGAMMAKVTSDLFDISELAHHGPENLFICTLKIVGSFVLLFMINGPLTAIMLAATVIMAALSFYLNYRRRTVFRENRERMAGINATVQDSLGGIRVVKSFGGEAAEEEKFRDANEAFLDTKKRSYRFMGAFHGMSSLFMGLLYTVTIVGGGYFVAQGTLQVTDLAIYALYIGIFFAPIEQLINFTETLQKGYAGFRRFMEVLEEHPDVANRPGARSLAEADPGERGHVEYHDVFFAYNQEEPVLRGLSLDIPAGATVALVGPSGGGKTTTCSLLPRFYDVDRGAITIDGVDIREVTVESLREAIGIVQQDVYLFGGTVRENIAYGRADATDEEIEQAARAANAYDFIMELPQGFDTLVGERGARLSGGQKQRIAIARVFLRNPHILILDEATSALDNESEHAVQESLAALSRGRTTLIIAHRLSTIRNAQLIAVVDEGRVVELGSHEELLAEGGTYARYYRMQFGEEKETDDGEGISQ